VLMEFEICMLLRRAAIVIIIYIYIIAESLSKSALILRHVA
jgi:hypothetical protein